MEANNKVLREVLEAVYRIAYTAKNDFDVFAGIERIRRISEAALAKPPRNCEVGTAEEQADRYEEFCAKYFAKDRDDDICGSCPLSNQSNLCKFAWAQMPYEE